jgi:hypothetical protein
MCKTLLDVTFEEDCKVRVISMDAFYHSGLQSVTIPESVKEIEPGCFCRCLSLYEVTFNGCPTIASAAFKDCPLDSVNVPDGIVLNYKFRFGAVDKRYKRTKSYVRLDGLGRRKGYGRHNQNGASLDEDDEYDRSDGGYCEEEEISNETR